MVGNQQSRKKMNKKTRVKHGEADDFFNYSSKLMEEKRRIYSDIICYHVIDLLTSSMRANDKEHVIEKYMRSYGAEERQHDTPHKLR
jgi:hypothetical protein